MSRRRCAAIGGVNDAGAAGGVCDADLHRGGGSFRRRIDLRSGRREKAAVEQAVDVHFTGSPDIDLAVGNRRDRKLYGIASLIAAFRALRTIPQLRRYVGCIEGVENGRPRAGTGRAVLRRIDRPENRGAWRGSVRGNRRRGTGKSKRS